jgi:hypothetical protein
MGMEVFELPERQSAPPSAAPACARDGAGGAVFTYPCGFGGAAARLVGRHLCVHGQ